ncbi:MAG: hypothetical protein KA911_09130 [Xanthomonadales bacterium]|jgi:hypothetical protein|nr:hypothetical protein [Xanthomonadales bacterium]MBP7418755.1 hypothetical protein [Xanthomonadales bacterium]
MRAAPLALILAVLPAAAGAQSALPFMRDLAQGRELPRPYGIGGDIFTMDQDYDIQRLEFSLPGVSIPDPSAIDVTNEIYEADLKFDAWLFPFLNVFGFYGHINGDTTVDLSGLPPLPLPFPLRTIAVDYSGQVYGGGATLAYGGEHWFASLTGTWADTDLSGGFDSSVKSTTWQPRVGYVNGPWAAWVGGFYIDAEEKHEGVFTIPGLGAIPFAVELESSDEISPGVGVHYDFGRRAEATLEFAGGDRTITLLNVTWRLGE